MTLVRNLLRSAKAMPEACAIQQGDAVTSYAALSANAFAVAQRLRAEGCRPGDRVAIALSNGADFVAAYYGALIAGAVAVLLNVAGKARDLSAWLANSDPQFVFTDHTHGEMQAALQASVSRPRVFEAVSGSTPFGFASAADHTVVDVRPQDPACILYTSGTTGQPKGVVLSHENLESNTRAIVSYLELTRDDSTVTVLPFYYSYGSSVLHTHLCVGGRVVIEQNLVYPHVIVQTLARERATGFAGVPSTFALLLARVKLGDFDLTHLRYLTQAGGAMSPALTKKLRAAVPNAKLFVMYGQTEATARLTYLPPHRLDEKLGSVGVPVSGIEIQIRDDEGHSVVAGEIGNVWVSGPNVMLGYWRNEAATAEVKQGAWLRTGDLGRLDEEGFLYLVGRRSDMIKAGAHRVHPQDVEDAIGELAAVREVAVVGVDDELLGQVIKAFVVLNDGATLTPMQVQAHCRGCLANYKVPKFVEFVASLPRTASGKIRRVELVQGIVG